MSWLARSLANSLRLDDDDGVDEDENDVAPFASNPQPHSQSSSLKHEIHQPQQQNQDQNDAIQSYSPLLQEEELQSRGVKEDLTELKQTFTRQLWGVASFLAPPPPPPPPPLPCPVDSYRQYDHRSASNMDQQEPSGRYVSEKKREPSDSGAVTGIRSDFAEIGGRFRSGVTEISKMASNYFPFGSQEKLEGNEGGHEEFYEEEEDEEEEEEDEEEEEEEEDEEEEEEELGGSAVGITEEVLAFARNIAMHPETWLDFPLDEEEDLDDFDMSDAQQVHALAIEHLAPRLAALRIELCPCHMTESYFWKVYFVLLHSRLNKYDAQTLSTKQVMEARALWMQELQKQTKQETDWPERNLSYLKDSKDVLEESIVASASNYAPPEYLSPRIYAFEPPSLRTIDYEMVKHPVESNEVQFIDKSVIEEKPVVKTEDKNLIVGPSSKTQIPSYEDDEYDWPEDDSDFGCSRAPIFMGNEDDVSFSDLEDDDDKGTMSLKSKMVSKSSES
ncbi:LOW QUALITY PROTEIN: FK506-binding protein 5 [Carica papaya]|uniref:LOW QUALITY PROTEIN: FK506-binding protein 5 n=1 Tax=Carica papaya TaxID=3649 RepID=UPI000B8CCDBA|nr:LOW QUALITY PROTEIN: FK506-binding protein 5 [Carica papaya]